MNKQKICVYLILLAITILKPTDDKGYTADWQNIIHDIKKDLEPINVKVER